MIIHLLEKHFDLPKDIQKNLLTSIKSIELHYENTLDIGTKLYALAYIERWVKLQDECPAENALLTAISACCIIASKMYEDYEYPNNENITLIDGEIKYTDILTGEVEIIKKLQFKFYVSNEDINQLLKDYTTRDSLEGLLFHGINNFTIYQWDDELVKTLYVLIKANQMPLREIHSLILLFNNCRIAIGKTKNKTEDDTPNLNKILQQIKLCKFRNTYYMFPLVTLLSHADRQMCDDIEIFNLMIETHSQLDHLLITKYISLVSINFLEKALRNLPQENINRLNKYLIKTVLNKTSDDFINEFLFNLLSIDSLKNLFDSTTDLVTWLNVLDDINQAKLLTTLGDTFIISLLTNASQNKTYETNACRFIFILTQLITQNLTTDLLLKKILNELVCSYLTNSIATLSAEEIIDGTTSLEILNLILSKLPDKTKAALLNIYDMQDIMLLLENQNLNDIIELTFTLIKLEENYFIKSIRQEITHQLLPFIDLASTATIKKHIPTLNSLMQSLLVLGKGKRAVILSKFTAKDIYEIASNHMNTLPLTSAIYFIELVDDLKPHHNFDHLVFNTPFYNIITQLIRNNAYDLNDVIHALGQHLEYQYKIDLLRQFSDDDIENITKPLNAVLQSNQDDATTVCFHIFSLIQVIWSIQHKDEPNYKKICNSLLPNINQLVAIIANLPQDIANNLIDMLSDDTLQTIFIPNNIPLPDALNVIEKYISHQQIENSDIYTTLMIGLMQACLVKKKTSGLTLFAENQNVDAVNLIEAIKKMEPTNIVFKTEDLTLLAKNHNEYLANKTHADKNFTPTLCHTSPFLC